MVKDHQKANLAIVILAAGSSSRMKAVKQLLPWEGTTLLGTVIEQALKSSIQHVYVVLGANYKLINKEIQKYPITILKNSEWELGMGTSISYVFKHFSENKINFDGVMIVLGDQPFVDCQYLNELVVAFNKNNQEKIIATNYLNKTGVPAIFPPNNYEQLHQLKEDFGARKILNSNSDNIYIINNEKVIIDIDTDDEYKEALKLN